MGDFPFCPHGRSGAAIVRDEIPGGQVFENGFDTPQVFYSHSAHRQALAARGLEIRAKWAGPHDTIMSNWAAGSVDLSGAERFVHRHYGPSEPKAERYPITVTTVERPR